jgi:hypothetical protein
MNPLLRSSALAVQRLFAGFDRSVSGLVDAPVPDTLAPIFLIGAPRTGSTLLFQLLAQRYRLSYISNLMALAPRYLVRLCRLSPGLCTGYQGGIRESSFGYVPGLSAPNEAGQLMRHWFVEDPDARHAEMVRATVASLGRIAKAPMFFKNQANTLRLPAVQRIFPNARLLYLRRDMRFTAQSLILVRRHLFGSADHWWSVAPPGHKDVQAREPLYQVLWQVERLEELALAACLDRPAQSIIVNYETLCTEPTHTLERIAERFGLALSNDAVPALNIADEVRLTASEWSHLLDLHAEYFREGERRRIELWTKLHS